MRPDYNGVKFYGKNDMSISWELEKALPILNSFDATEEYNDINAVLELYSIQQLVETGASLSSWTDTERNNYCLLTKEFNPVIGRFFNKIDDSNFIEIQENVCAPYFDEFWELFVKYKVYRRISSKVMNTFLNQSEGALCNLLKHKELAEYFDGELANALRFSGVTVHILVRKFLKNSKTSYYLPKSFIPSEYDGVFMKYVCSDHPNANVLQIICRSQSTAECPIGDKLRLEAKRALDKFRNKHLECAVVFGHGVEVSFQEQDELVKHYRQGNDYCISYDVRWLEDSLDYPTILNNFRYVFEMFDAFGRSSLVSVESQISAFESAFSLDGVKFYKKGNYFDITDMMSNAQMTLYYSFLLNHGINLEAVFKWFFEQYLLEEFGVEGFWMNISSLDSTYIEKCRNLAAEMEAVLRQFRMFARDGMIDRELFQLSSEHMIIGKIPSLMDKKYAYALSDDLNKELFVLFSDQSSLGYTERTEGKYSTLFELLENEEMNINDFREWQLDSLKWLYERGSVLIDDSGMVKLVTTRTLVLKDLYEHDVLCLKTPDKWKAEIDSMIRNGDLIVESSLFSRPENDYLNYELNKSQFSDGKDLRNKYVHGTYPIETEEQQRDYMQLLKLMVLVVTKINDDFCFWADSKKSQQ